MRLRAAVLDPRDAVLLCVDGVNMEVARTALLARPTSLLAELANDANNFPRWPDGRVRVLRSAPRVEAILQVCVCVCQSVCLSVCVCL